MTDKEKIKNLSRTMLKVCYKLALNNKENNAYIKLTMNDIEEENVLNDFAKNVEKVLNNVGSDEYYYNLAKLKIFIDPKHHIGQYANLFRSKLLQNIYTYPRLIELDIIDLLPEVFMNPNTEQNTKIELYNVIDETINNEANNIKINVSNIIDPTKRIKAKVTDVFMDAETAKTLKSNNKNIKDICDNPSWAMKEVNIIVCKEKDMFYCLDIEELLKQIAEKNTANNYITNKPLNAEIVDNLKTRYEYEISQLKKGKNIYLGKYTNNDIDDIKSNLVKLERFRFILNKLEVQKQLEKTLNISVINDPNIGEENSLDLLPKLILKKFQNKLKENKILFDEKLSFMNNWIDNVINSMNKILKSDNDRTNDHTNDSKKDLEVHLIREKVLVKNNMSYELIKKYNKKLERIKESIMEHLSKINNMEIREELNEYLHRTNKVITDLNINSSTIDGIIDIIKNEINNPQKGLKKQLATGMDIIFPNNNNISNEEKINIEEYNKVLQLELVFLTNLKQELIEPLEGKKEGSLRAEME